MLKIKSIIAMLMATAMTAFAAPMIMVNAAEQEVHGTGLLLGAEEEMEVLSESDSTDSRITLPSQVDLIERLYRQYAIENGLDANADVNALMGGASAAEVR